MTVPTGVHPLADLFPMFADEELKELAESIAKRGLAHPIILDTEGRVLDGRNRLAACQMAGVEPTFTTYDGDDPDGYAWSVNVNRRSLTKAQTALAAADRFAGKNLPTREQAEVAGVSHPMIVWAHAVRRYRDLHDEVLSRGGSLRDAYGIAQKRDEAEAVRQTQIGRLRVAAPDLLAVVDDELMSLDDAIAALDARELKAEQEAEAERHAEELRAGEAERQLAAEEQERQQSLERDRGRLRMVVSGWPTVRSILDDQGGALTVDILKGLGESDREAIQQIIAEIGA